MKRTYAVLLATLLWAFATNVQAETLDEIFRSGNEALGRGDYAAAQQRYRRVIDAGVRDPDVFMNSGLAYAHGGELGPAILAFEKVLDLRPDDGEAAAALAIARAAVGKRRAERHGEATVETRPPLAEALVRSYREDSLAILSLFFDALCFAALLGHRRARSDQLRTGLAVTASLAGLCALLFLSGLAIKRGAFREGQPAIVLRDGAELREAPDPRALARGEAAEGGSAQVLAREAGFARVRTATGALGWITDTDIGLIDD
jgi:tetratricopeptide (TPR) repeat protein